MRFKSLHKKAQVLDDLIDGYINTKSTSFVPRHQLQEIVVSVFPDSALIGVGLHKLVFHLRHKEHNLALKVGQAKWLERDHRAYRQMPPRLRHVYFARVFWHTKYALLQEFGVEAEVSQRQLLQFRAIASRYGLLDITCDNIRKIDGALKIIDAGVSPPGFFRLWKTADTIARRLPTPISRAIRKSRLLTAPR